MLEHTPMKFTWKGPRFIPLRYRFIIMTSCMLVELRNAVDAQEIPVESILEQQDVAVIFNPESMDMRANACVQDAAWNAGVRIR